MYILGLDIGTTSVGYGVLNLDVNFEPNRIITMGTRVFDAAENPKNGASLALPRREARGARRRNRRHRHRMDRIKSLISKNEILNKAQMSEIYKQKQLTDIYEIRCMALDRALNNEEFARLLIHLAQKRGFKSNRKNEATDKEGGKLLKATAANAEVLAEKGYLTVGEMLYKDENFANVKRNKGGDYSKTFLRSQIEDEIKIIFTKQREFANTFATVELEQEYLNIWGGQRSFDEGPGAGPYSGDQIEKMVGKCTFEPSEERAAKATYSFEYFNLLTKVNNLAVVCGNQKRFLTQEERKTIVDLCHKTEKITYKKIRSELKLGSDALFNSLTYGDKDINKVEETKFEYLPAYHEMRRSFDKISKGYINNVNHQQRNAIGRVLTFYKTDTKIKEKLSEIKDIEFTDIETERILEMKSFAKVGNLSIKAINKIIPFLEEGLSYDKACEKAGYNFKGHNGSGNKYLAKLPEDLYEVTSPVAKRAINQTIKVVNEIIRKYGSPALVNVELAREMSKNFDERRKIEKDQKENEKNNEKVVEKLKELGVTYPKGQDIIKYRLWEEQQAICLYTQEPLKIEDLFKEGYAEIDHIIPYSISFDDTYKNKVLVKTYANREKGNRLPLEYVKSKDDYIALVNALIRNKNKKDRLLKEFISEEEEKELKQRSLQDTQHISKFMLNYIRDNLQFDPRCDKKIKIKAVNGVVTGYMRKRWGISKIRENGDLHHGIDAVTVACITEGIIQKVTKFSKYIENYTNIDNCSKEYQDVFNNKHFPLPWPEFRKELEIRTFVNPKAMLLKERLPNYDDVNLDEIKPIFVSRMVRKKATGQAHKDTIRGSREINGEMKTVTKTSLQDLKYDKAKDEIIGYYNPDSDKLLYELLKEKLKLANGDGKSAFPDGKILKPAPKGGKQPEVRKVKIWEKSSLNVEVNKGVAANGDMVRIDLYHIENDGFYFVPIYVSDLCKDKLPNKACVAAKSYAEWKEMSDEDFLYSIYPNDLIKIASKKSMAFNKVFEDANIPQVYETQEEFVYYKKSGIAGGTITIINHDNSYTIKSLGVKTLLSIEKYHVDILGNRYKAEKEVRK